MKSGVNLRCKRLRKFVLIAVITFLVGGIVIVLGGCETQPPSRQSFENMPAILIQAPCIAGVCIGDAGRQEISVKLSQNELLYNIRDNNGVPVWFSVEGGGGGGVMFRQRGLGAYEVVERIRLDAVGMPLGKALDTLGEPDEMFLMFGCGRGSHVYGKLFYRHKGIEVQVQFPAKMDDRAASVVLNDRTPVQWVWYFDPLLYDEWLLGIYEAIRLNGYFDIPRDVTPEMLAAAVQPWPGTGVPIETLDLCPR